MPEIGEQQKPIEAEIRKAEKALGLESEYDKQAEAALFIDKKFLNYALITGVTKQPERVFGDNRWADYIDGRLFARQYGAQELTPDFILQLHSKLTKRSNPRKAGKIRKVGVFGAADDAINPVTYTPEQVKAIEQNPMLTFRREPPDDENSTTGYIVYPHSKPGTQIQEAVEHDLNELCKWFNSAKKQDLYNPHIVAGLLQHRFISLHPFMDSNGTMSRVLMNWSLENDGESPSVIDNPDSDILTDQETWISYITEGSRQHKAIKKRQTELQEAGIDNINALFDLGQDTAFYDYIFRHIKKAPNLSTNGDLNSHKVFEEFLQDFRIEMGHFQSYMSGTSTLKMVDGERQLSHGGLISPEFIDFVSASGMQVLPLEIKKQFFTGTEVYRGGMFDNQVNDEMLCQMFLSFNDAGADYRSLVQAHHSGSRLQNIDWQVVRESMEYYNRMLAYSYFAKKHPDMQNPYTSQVRDLNQTVSEHVLGDQDIWNSPFASTSLSYEESRNWANRWLAPWAKNSRSGVLIKAQLPTEGVIMTFGQKFEGLTAAGIQYECEALVAGCIQPSSITGIEVFEKGSAHQNPAILAKRVEEDGKVSVVVEDRRGDFVVNRTYTYNFETANFVLSGESATDIPSTKPIDVPAVFVPPVSKHPAGWIGGYKKEYNTPFKHEKYFIPTNITSDKYEKKEKFENIILGDKYNKGKSNNLLNPKDTEPIYEILKKEDFFNLKYKEKKFDKLNSSNSDFKSKSKK